MDKVFTCSGDAGDVIYALASLKKIGRSHLRLTPSTNVVRQGYSPAKAESEANLIRVQDYISSCQYCTQEGRDELLAKGAVNIDGFRKEFKGGNNIIDWISDYLGQGSLPHDPWLTVPSPNHVADVVIHRSPRYHNELFPWREALALYAGRIVMVGGGAEHQDFMGRFGAAPPHHYTKDFLELAQVIAGAKLFIGNQSSPMAIALGLGVRVIQEVCEWTPNCLLTRHDAQYVRGCHARWPAL